MPVQDDVRENELIKLFNLRKPDNATRGGTDAVLDFEGKELEFELKSTTTGSVTTVRDFGPEHIKKWIGKHWLVGVYDENGANLQYCLYGSPKQMEPWIKDRELYIGPDFSLIKKTPELLTLDDMYEVLGKKEKYTLQDALALQKKQYTTAEYHELMDIENGYSPERMLKILQDRCRYLLSRGATLNNPHIPASYFQGWEKITENHIDRLRELVAEALQDKV